MLLSIQLYGVSTWLKAYDRNVRQSLIKVLAS